MIVEISANDSFPGRPARSLGPPFALAPVTSTRYAESKANKSGQNDLKGKRNGKQDSQGRSRLEAATHAESILCDQAKRDRTAVYRQIRGHRNGLTEQLYRIRQAPDSIGYKIQLRLRRHQ